MICIYILQKGREARGCCHKAVVLSKDMQTPSPLKSGPMFMRCAMLWIERKIIHQIFSDFYFKNKTNKQSLSRLMSYLSWVCLPIFQHFQVSPNKIVHNSKNKNRENLIHDFSFDSWESKTFFSWESEVNKCIYRVDIVNYICTLILNTSRFFSGTLTMWRWKKKY